MTAEVNEKTVGFESPFAWPFHPLAGHGVRVERFGFLEFHRLQARGGGGKRLTHRECPAWCTTLELPDAASRRRHDAAHRRAGAAL